MSSDFYFRKWKTTLTELENLVHFDIEYQVSKAHDQTECQAVHRLTAVLGQYMTVYNHAIECLEQNLQVQKTVYLKDIIKAVVSRILELKHELQKVEGSSIQFFGRSLTEHLLTIDDVEMKALPEKIKRSKDIQSTIEDALQRAREKREALANSVLIEDISQNVQNWWDDDYNKDEEEKGESMKEKEIPEEVRKTKDMVVLIQAHERSRQTICLLLYNKQKREHWEKQLAGNLQPPAKSEQKERGAKFIQKLIRAYNVIKRERIKQCKRDEKLGIIVCNKPNRDARNKAEEMLENRCKLHECYEMEWKKRHEKIKEEYLRRKRDCMIEDYRDQIRDWFVYWFERVHFFHDIPKIRGSAAIFKGDVPEPEEWLEEYEKFLNEKQGNKNKSLQQKKLEKLEAQKELAMLKREEKLKKRAEEAFLKKMMKNPTMHPGYDYPQSKKTDHLLQAIKEYHSNWDQYDKEETKDVKEKFVYEVDVKDTLMEAQLEVLPVVDEQMGNELHKLKMALKEDYVRNEMKMPEQINKNKPRTKKIKKVKSLFNQKIVEKIEDLAVKGFIKEYPKTKIEDYIGDPNFAGEDLRCNLQPALPYHGQLRASWWERCRQMAHGFHKLLLVGPKGGGKTQLVHALASINNAILFELDPVEVQGDFLSAAYLQQLAQTVAACAKAIQPSVIHIRHVQKLFYSKIYQNTKNTADAQSYERPAFISFSVLQVPQEEADMCFDLVKNSLVRKLFKRFQKTDNITVVGTCVEPWVAKSTQMLKQFSTVLLLPNTTYSVVVQMLKEWVISYNVIPADFNVSNLAYVLQGYSFGYLKQALERFMCGDRIAQIAASGLNPTQVYDFILEDSFESKTLWPRREETSLNSSSWGGRAGNTTNT